MLVQSTAQSARLTMNDVPHSTLQEKTSIVFLFAWEIAIPSLGQTLTLSVSLAQ